MDGWMKFIAGNLFFILFFYRIYDLVLVMYAFFKSTFLLLLYSFRFGFGNNKLYLLYILMNYIDLSNEHHIA